MTERPPQFKGDFYAGVDIGQKRDHSAVGVVKKIDRVRSLVHLKQFKLGTEYGTVLGYLKILNEQLETLHRILIDQTGVGEVFVEEARKSGLKNAEGVMLSLPEKENIMTYMKQTMQEDMLQIPYDMDLINEINVERYELTKAMRIQFSHPAGTHDDRLWALALAIYISRPEAQAYHPVVMPIQIVKPVIGYANLGLERQSWKRDPLANVTSRVCMACGTRRDTKVVACPKCGMT